MSDPRSRLTAAIKSAPFNPIVTGTLLLALLRSPPASSPARLREIRERVLALLGSRAATVITTLKVLFSLGLASRISAYLDAIAQRGWRLRRPGTAWTFSKSGGSGEIILVTGACSGFGLRQLQLFSARAPNAALVTIDRQSPPPAELTLLPNLTYYNADLTDIDSVREVTARIKQEVGDPTVLVNNAGIAGPLATILDMDYESMQRVFAVNVFAHVPMIQAFLPAMLKQKRGHIVTVASMASFITVSGIVDYCASKAAVNSLHDGLRYELIERYGPDGASINTTSVHPTWAPTRLTTNWMKKPSRTTSPDEVATAIVDQVLAGRSGKITVPSHLSKILFVLGLPLWVQEFARAGTEKTTRTA